jgi:hypothetical protein
LVIPITAVGTGCAAKEEQVVRAVAAGRAQRPPAQCVLVEAEVTHDLESLGYRAVFRGAAHRPHHVPPSLVEPIDFRGGTAHLRAAVRSVPHDARRINYLCRLLTVRHARETTIVFGLGALCFSRPGVYYHAQPLDTAAPMVTPTEFRWDAPLYEIQLVVADANGQMVHTDYEIDRGTFVGAPDVTRYFPVTVAYTLILVAQGADLAPPEGW